MQLAILHAEFEALHPFLDGNGRLGRMLTKLREHEILRVIKPANGRRGTILVFPDLLNIAEGRQAF